MIDGAMQPFALTLDRFIDHAAKWHPKAEIVTAGEGSRARIDYAGLRERSNRLSGALAALGLERGDRLAVLANWWMRDAVVRVDAVPLAQTGKINKMRLRAL